MTTSPKPLFAIKLKGLRTQRGLSQTQVAEQLGTDFRVVSRWERGLHLPTAYFRPKLCDLFGMTLDELGLAKPLPLVFLSYASTEQEFVDQLKLDLEKRGIAVWQNEEGKISSVDRKEDLRKIIQEVQVTILIASPDAREAHHVKQELEVAELCKCPVRVLWRAGERRRDAIPPNQSAARFIDAVDVRDNTSYESVIEEFIDNLSLLFAPTEGTDTSRKPTFEPRNPYKGLQAFHEDEKDDFFGRDRLTDELADELEEILASGERARLLAVVGHSGSGKSSVVMAGLLPLLQRGELTESQEWIYLDPMTPGTDPIETLSLRLAKHLPERSIESICRDLATDKASGLHLLASTIAKQPARKVVLVVDQFEELFTQTTDEELRTQFINLLVKACQMPDGSLLVILTLRADFYHKLMYHEELGKIIEKQSKLVFPMNMREIRAIIERPTLLPDVCLTFESNLVEDLLSEVKGQIGALPLLQFTLDQLFQRRDGLQLTYATYEAIGKVEGALAHYADQIYETLDEEKKRRTRNILLQMVQPGNGVADTRRMARRGEIGEEDWKLVLWLSDKRLVVTSTTADGHEIAEIAHEALIQNWGQLQNWMKVDRGFRTWQERLRSALRQWEENGQDLGGLLRGMPLAEAKRWLNERDQQITGKERDFLFQCILLEGSELQEWVPRYGTVEETLAFITPYTSSADEQKKLISIDALRWLPHSNTDNEIYDLLLQLALEDPSLIVRKKATQSICERGHTSELAQLLAPNKLTKQKKQRLTKALASVRNVPKIGYEVEKALHYSKRRILFSAMLELIYTYRNHFAIIMFFSYVIGQMLLLFVNVILVNNLPIETSGIDVTTLIGNIFKVVITLSICLYLNIRKNHIDSVKLSVKGCIAASLYFILIFDVTYLIYSCTIYIFVTGGVRPSPHYISLIVSRLLPDAVALPIIAQVLRTNLSSRGAIWRLLWTAIVGIGLLITIEEFLVPQISFLAHSTQLFTSRSISYAIFSMRKSFYEQLHSISSIFFTLVIGILSGFGSLLGLRFGFLSAFNSKNKAKPFLRPSIMTLLSRIRQQELPVRRVSNRVDLQHIFRALPKSFYLVILLALLGPVCISWISRSLAVPQPLSSYHIGASYPSVSPNGRLATYRSNDGAIRVLDTMTGKLLYKYSGHPISNGPLDTRDPGSAIWSPDSTKLTATFAYDDAKGVGTDYQTETWDATTGKILYVLPVRDFDSVRWSPDSEYIAIPTYNGSIEVRDATTGKLYRSHSGWSGEISWSPDSARIISTTDQTIEVWNVFTGETLYIYHLDDILTVRSIHTGWSPNNKYIYLMVYREVFHKTSIELEILDASSFEIINMKILDAEIYQSYNISIYWSPNGKYLAIVGNLSVKIWDVLSEKDLYTYPGHIGQVNWSPNSEYLAIVGNLSVKIWDVLSGKDLYTYPGHIGQVNNIAWSPDSRRIASVGEDGSIQVWDATTGNNVNAYCVYPAETNYWNIIIGKESAPQAEPLSEVVWIPESNNIIAVSVGARMDGTTQRETYTEIYTIYNWQIT
jgi:WD40 repeat protein/transcriptional regulator with XRE-family HTH domain/ABC-type dipeptide/oligopeptide/nickel transport system ATPase component